MRKYSWLILCLALAVLLAFAFTRADNQTEPAFGYTLDFKKPLSGIDNLSSLSYVPEEDVFVATLNRPATILKLSKNGEILARKSIADRIKDAESIEYVGNGTYLLVDEADSAMYVYQLSQNLDVRSVRKIETDLFENARNRESKALPGWPDEMNSISPKNVNRSCCTGLKATVALLIFLRSSTG